jgi:hypothetical protein
MIKRIYLFNFLVLIVFSAVSAESINKENTVTSAEFTYKFTDTPDWVQQQNISKVKQTEAKTSVSYMLVDSQVDWTQTEEHSFQRLAYKINSEQGLQLGSEFSMSFNPEYQSLQIHTLEIIRGGKVIDLKQSADIRLLQQEQEITNRMLTGIVNALVVLSDVRVGDIVDYSYSVIGNNPVFGTKRFFSSTVSWTVPVSLVNVRLLTHRGSYVNYQSVGNKKEVVQRNKGDRTIYSFSEKNVDQISSEDSYPGWFIPNDYIEFSEYESWEEVNEWALSLYGDQGALSNEVKKQNDEWYEYYQDKKHYVEKVVEFVQNEIRYFGMELGQNSHKPHHPNETFARRYGDCKDKALMISSLLAEKGIKAWSALVSTTLGKAIEQRIPSPGIFDHVITTLELDGETYWVDGTRTHQYGSLENISAGDYRFSLIVDPQTSNLSTVSVNRKAPHTSTINEHLTSTGYNKPVMMDFELIYSGWNAENARRTIDNSGVEEFSTSILNYYRKQYLSIEWQSPLTVEDDHEKNSLSLKGKMQINDYWDIEKPQFSIALYGDNLSSYVQLPSVIERQYPLAVSSPMEISHNISVSLNEDIDWELGEEDLEITDPAIHYARIVKTSPRQVSVNHVYKSKRDHVSPNELEQHFKNIQSIREAMYLSAQIPNTASNTDQSTLKNKMRSLLKL